MTPVLISGMQCLLDEQPAKARAIDEQVTFDDLSVAERDGLNRAPRRAAGASRDSLRCAPVATLRRHADIYDLSLGPYGPTLLGIAAQERGVKSGVELVGIGERREQRTAIRCRDIEPIEVRGDDWQRIV